MASTSPLNAYVLPVLTPLQTRTHDMNTGPRVRLGAFETQKKELVLAVRVMQFRETDTAIDSVTGPWSACLDGHCCIRRGHDDGREFRPHSARKSAFPKASGWRSGQIPGMYGT